MTSACYLGKFLCQNCVNMAVGMGLFGPCLGWNRACSRSLQPGSVAVVIVPGLARLIKQSRETRTGEQQNGTGAQRPCPSPCMPGRISLCRSMPVYEGHLQEAPLYVRRVLQQGRTYNRVPGRASRAQGHPQGALLRGQVVSTGQDIQADRFVSVNNPPLLPLATC